MSDIERDNVDLTTVKESLTPVIWVVGGPGSGRSTQCEILEARHGWRHISSGDLLRHEVMSGSKRGSQLFSVMAAGNMVPNEVVLDILARKMADTVDGATGFLIDGFPLDLEEAAAFEQQVVPVTRIVYLKLEKEDMLQRLTDRNNFDDKREAIEKRIEIFEKKTLPVIEKYNCKTVEVDASLERDEQNKTVLEALTGTLKHGGRGLI